MATLDEIADALRNAHAAGDTAAATKLADAYAAMQASGRGGGIADLIRGKAPKREPSTMDTAIDMARSIPGGLAKGAAAIAGIPGDLQSLIAPSVQKMPLGLPTSAEISSAISAPTRGFYEPKTVPGQYTETAASFAPAALSPGSIPARVARVVVPAAASETAGQLTKGTPYEPYARMAAGLAGGLAQGLGEGVIAERGRSASIPTTQQLKTAGQAAYQTADAQGLVVTGKSFGDAVDKIATDLQKRGINSRIPPSAQARLYPKGSAALEILQKAKAKGKDIGLSDIDKLRQVARIALESNDKADRSVAHAIIDGIDDFVGNLKPTDVVQGNMPAAVSAIKDARELWTKMSKSDIIDRALAKAEASRGQFTGAGYENALRVQFRNLAKNEKAMRQFTPAEQAAIKKVEAGGPVENIFRFIGKFSPHGMLNAMASAGIGYGAAGGVAGVLPALAVGEAGRQAATALTARNARLASEAVRSGAPPVRQLQGPVIQNALAAGVLSRGQPLNALMMPTTAPRQ